VSTAYGDWFDLSGDELRTRLILRGCSFERAIYLVKQYRDSPDPYTIAAIQEVFDGD
jgi:hypothetical protein